MLLEVTGARSCADSTAAAGEAVDVASLARGETNGRFLIKWKVIHIFNQQQREVSDTQI